MPIISSLAALSAKGFGAGLSNPTMGGSGFIDTSTNQLSTTLNYAYGATDSLGNFYFINSFGSGASGYRGYVVKVTSVGAIVWAKQIYFGGTTASLEFKSIYIDSSDNIFIGCNIVPGQANGAPGILKLTTAGATTFGKDSSYLLIPGGNFQNAYNGTGQGIISMTTDSSGNIYGLSYPVSNDPSQYGYVLKYDSIGTGPTIGRYNSVGGIVGYGQNIKTYSTYTISTYITTGGTPYIVCNNADGSNRWSFNQYGDVYPTFAIDNTNGIIYCLSNTSIIKPHIYAINIATGQILNHISGTPGLLDNVTLTVDSSGYLYMIHNSTSNSIPTYISKFNPSTTWINGTSPLIFENVLSTIDPIYSVAMGSTNLTITTTTFTVPISGSYSMSSKYYSVPISGKIPNPGSYTGGYTYYKNSTPVITWTYDSTNIGSYVSGTPISIVYGSTISSSTPSVNNTSTSTSGAQLTVTTMQIGS